MKQKLKNFLSSYKQILRIFRSISHIFTYICPCFVRVCRHHSTKSAKWGAFDTVCPLSASGGQLPPLPPPPCPRLRCLWMEVVVTTGAISHAKLHSNHHHQQTNIQFFYRPDAIPVAQPTVSNH